MKVLVVEDSERLRRSLGDGLCKSGFAVDLAADGEAGLALALGKSHDVIVLDLMLPKLDGIEMLRRLRTGGSDAHVLVVSARDRTENRIEGLNVGADDYLVKPFEFDELLARINALVRRRYGSKQPMLTVADVELDTNARVVRRAGELVPLTRLEYRLLELLMLRRGRVHSRAQILDHLYDSDADPASNVVEVLVYSLRRKLARRAGREIVVTRRGQGYLVEAQ